MQISWLDISSTLGLFTTALLFIIHGLVMDPELKDRPVDWLDAEKLVSEICCVILIAATLLRYKYHTRNK